MNSYIAKQTHDAIGIVKNSILLDGDLIADCFLPSESKQMAQMLNEHAALVAVAEAIKNCDTQIIRLLVSVGCDGNAIEIQSALAQLAAVREGKI